MKIIQFILLMVISVSASAGIIRFENSYYEWLDGYETQSRAQYYAEKRTLRGVADASLFGTGYLANITSQREQDFLYHWFRNMYGWGVYLPLAWIGLTDAGTEGTFQYMSGPEAGQDIVFSSWARHEPNDYRSGEDFVVMNWDWWGNWNDYGLPNRNFKAGILVEYSLLPRPASALCGDTILSMQRSARSNCMLSAPTAVSSPASVGLFALALGLLVYRRKPR